MVGKGSEYLLSSNFVSSMLQAKNILLEFECSYIYILVREILLLNVDDFPLSNPTREMIIFLYL